MTELKTAVDHLKYYWSDGYDHGMVLGPMAERIRRETLSVCVAYEHLASVMPDIYEAVVQAKAYMTPDTRSGERAQAMLLNVFNLIRSLPECQK